MNKQYKENLLNTETEEENDDRCDLDPNKICDNCCKCIESDKNYKIIKITKIITDENYKQNLSNRISTV